MAGDLSLHERESEALRAVARLMLSWAASLGDASGVARALGRAAEGYLAVAAGEDPDGRPL